MIRIALVVLIAISCLTVLRIILGPSVWDRLMGLNLFSSKLIMVIMLFAFLNNRDYLLDVAIAYSLLGFVSVIFIAGFIQRRGRL